jgi:hypothetical protein
MARTSLLAVLLVGLTTGIATMSPALAAEPPPVKLTIKPLLCVLEKDAATCSVTFDVRWNSIRPSEYCLHDSINAAPLRCWSLAVSGAMKHERSFSEDFRFWLTPPAGGERLSEVKIEVLRVGSTDRRRERRTRHVWDVL